jgi:protease-4
MSEKNPNAESEESPEQPDDPEETPASPDEPDSEAESGPPGLTQRQRYAGIVFAAIAALVVGAVLATAVYGYTNSMASSEEQPDGKVAVIKYDGPIVAGSGETVEEELRKAREDDSIKAVVLEINTPGGQPAPSERMYLAVQKTAKEMPVIASVQRLSASGGYYAMAPADDIYVLPNSLVGSVGVAASAPRSAAPVRGPTGPDKRGSNSIQQWALVESLRSTFLQTVMENRGDRLDMPAEEVGKASIFLGTKAVENGFADQIGTVDDAVADAAERAGLEEYEIVERDASFEFFPILLSTDSGMAVVEGENPSYGEVHPVDYALVYEPEIPHIDELEEVVSNDVEDLLEEMNEEDEADDESGGEQP